MSQKAGNFENLKMGCRLWLVGLGSACMIMVGCGGGGGGSVQTKKLTPDPDNGGLFLPGGFQALVVADSVGRARHLAVNGNGDIYVKLIVTTGQMYDLIQGNVALRDTDGDGKADIIQKFGQYANDGPFATDMRIRSGYLYFSTEQVVFRQMLTPGRLIPEGEPEVLLVDHHPPQWHNAKSLAFDNRGGMYVTFSAPTNACEDWTTVKEGGPTAGVRSHQPCPELFDQGGIWRFDENKPGQRQSDGTRFATGLRSIVGITWNDEDSSLYAIQHGRDYLGEHDPKHFSAWQNAVMPAEEFARVKEGEDYGWPYTYIDPIKNKRMIAPEYGGDGKKEAKGYADPIMGLPAHWAPNDLLFYKGRQFPSRYRQGAFVAFHGSTNRFPYPQGGYFVAFIPFENGNPVGNWEVFADGFAGVDTIRTMSQAKYRPCGLAEGPDGSLYISDSKKGKIWRVLFTGDPSSFGAAQLATMEARKSLSHLKTPDEHADPLK